MSPERQPGTIEQKLDEIAQRVRGATPDLVEEPQSHGWVVSTSLSPGGSRVYSPLIGIVREGDYQLFLHARDDLKFLLEQIEQLRNAESNRG